VRIYLGKLGPSADTWIFIMKGRFRPAGHVRNYSWRLGPRTGTWFYMIKRRLKLAGHVENYSWRLGHWTNTRFYMINRRLKTCRTYVKLFMKTGTLNKHKILLDGQKAQNLQDMWKIILGA
jgi:hypothetical protein